MALATNADDFLATVVWLYLSNNWTQLFASVSPLFKALYAKKRNILTGWGRGLRYPIAVPQSGPTPVTVSTTGVAYTALTWQETSFGRVAEFQPCEIVLPVSVQNRDLLAARGDAAKLDFVQGVIDANLQRFMETLKSQLWATEESGSGGYADYPNRPALGSIRVYINGGTAATTTDSLTPAEKPEQLGARGVVSASGAAPVTTVGNISRAQSGGGRWTPCVVTTSQNLSAAVLGSLYRLAATDTDQPDLGITTLDVFSKLESIGLLMGSQWPGFARGGDAVFGYNSMRYLTMDIVYDDACPKELWLGTTQKTGHNFFVLNTNHLYLWRDAPNPVVQVVPSDGRPLKRWTITHYAQLTSDNLGRVHARHVDLNLGA